MFIASSTALKDESEGNIENLGTKTAAMRAQERVFENFDTADAVWANEGLRKDFEAFITNFQHSLPSSISVMIPSSIIPRSDFHPQKMRHHHCQHQISQT